MFPQYVYMFCFELFLLTSDLITLGQRPWHA